MVDTFGKFLLLRLRSDWTINGQTYPAGALLLAENFDDYLNGGRNLSVLFRPTERASLNSITGTKHYLILTALDNVHSRPSLLRFEHGKWNYQSMTAPPFGTLGISGIDANESDDYFMTMADFLTPSSLYLGVAGKGEAEKIKAVPALFNSEGLEIQQFEAKSRDGTMIPYFQVGRKGLRMDSNNVTLLNGYGGFEIPMLPSYNAIVGATWLERGGVYVLANIRGGGEFGPMWHEAARKQNRQRAYDDFYCCRGGFDRAGGYFTEAFGDRGGAPMAALFMGVMLTERPDLFGAIHCGSPLLDMRRYNKLLAGASWMDEYGELG